MSQHSDNESRPSERSLLEYYQMTMPGYFAELDGIFQRHGFPPLDLMVVSMTFGIPFTLGIPLTLKVTGPCRNVNEHSVTTVKHSIYDEIVRAGEQYDLRCLDVSAMAWGFEVERIGEDGTICTLWYRAYLDLDSVYLHGVKELIQDDMEAHR